MTRTAKTLAEIRKFARDDARRGVMRAFKTPRRIGMKKAASAYHAAYRKRNPVEPLQSRVDASASAFRNFTGHDARGVRKVRVKSFSVGWPLGKLDAVLYSTVRDGKREKYIHRFRSNSRPHLVSSSDGSALAIVGGRYSIKDSGINDE